MPRRTGRLTLHKVQLRSVRKTVAAIFKVRLFQGGPYPSCGKTTARYHHISGLMMLVSQRKTAVLHCCMATVRLAHQMGTVAPILCICVNFGSCVVT